VRATTARRLAICPVSVPRRRSSAAATATTRATLLANAQSPRTGPVSSATTVRNSVIPLHVATIPPSSLTTVDGAMVVETLELPLVVGVVAVEMLRLLLATGPTVVKVRSQPATGLTRLPLLPMVPMATPGVTVAALLSVGNFNAEVFVGVNGSPTPL
jgi:hypothetical protein